MFTLILVSTSSDTMSEVHLKCVRLWCLTERSFGLDTCLSYEFVSPEVRSWIYTFFFHVVLV